MPTATCSHCNSTFEWHWEAAFAKWGFGPGTGPSITEWVTEFLTQSGYKIITRQLEQGNTIIISIRKGKQEFIPADINIGHVHPNEFLPAELIKLLQQKFSSKRVCDWFL